MEELKRVNLHIVVITSSLFRPGRHLNKKVSKRLAEKGLAASKRNLVYELKPEDVLELVLVSEGTAKQYIDVLKRKV